MSLRAVEMCSFLLVNAYCMGLQKETDILIEVTMYACRSEHYLQDFQASSQFIHTVWRSCTAACTREYKIFDRGSPVILTTHSFSGVAQNNSIQ